MKTINFTNLAIAVFGTLAVGFFTVNLIETKGLTVIGDVVAYMTAFAIIVAAGVDNTRAKKLG